MQLNVHEFMYLRAHSFDVLAPDLAVGIVIDISKCSVFV
jgi:hypothetical protein